MWDSGKLPACRGVWVDTQASPPCRYGQGSNSPDARVDVELTLSITATFALSQNSQFAPSPVHRGSSSRLNAQAELWTPHHRLLVQEPRGSMGVSRVRTSDLGGIGRSRISVAARTSPAKSSAAPRACLDRDESAHSAGRYDTWLLECDNSRKNRPALYHAAEFEIFPDPFFSAVMPPALT